MNTKATFFLFSFCSVFDFYIYFCWLSRSECEKRKAIWDACVAEINEEPDLKEKFDAQMLAAMDLMGQLSRSNRMNP